MTDATTKHRSEPSLVAFDGDEGRIGSGFVELGFGIVVVGVDQSRKVISHRRAVREPPDPPCLLGVLGHEISIDDDGTPPERGSAAMGA
jgi:hypothetical protein